MTPEKFKSIRKKLGHTQKVMGIEIGVVERTVQDYESGKTSIPKPVSLLMNIMAESIGRTSKKSINLDVSDVDKISMEQMVDFCFENEEHQDYFLQIPAIRLLIASHRKDAEAKTMEKVLLLRNQSK